MMMKNQLQIGITMNGQPVSQAQVTLVAGYRAKHVLQEMQSLGIDVPLTTTEINYLSSEAAIQQLIKVKSQLSPAEIKAKYQQPLAAADDFWRAVAHRSNGREQLQESRVDLSVTGFSMQQLQQVLGSELDANFAAKINPEHFYSDGSVATGQHIIETFGCFGEPTEMDLHVETTDYTPVEPNPDYPLKMNGYTTLHSDGTDFDGGLRAFHQVKPRTDGFDAILAAYVPSATPQEIVLGHQWHLAIEFSEMIKFAAAHQE
ncbi:hypothetical protein [Lactiplantibacillus carotarum]|uniref:hypothetical protein n=1 Tax=Lactiplantibacillus carotarum TaxID=2993456 RepID=UPI00298F0A00|nr:hypothetical protein [Lactiplantibacillus carotarum]